MWHRATLSAVVSHVLGGPGWGFEAARARLEEEFAHGRPAVLSELRAPRSIYAEVTRIVREHRSVRSLDAFLHHPDWGEVERVLGTAMAECPPMCFYLDALDEHFEAAPHQWLLCQLGLFRFVVRARNSEHFGSRLHIIITLRDIAYSTLLQSEHASRYRHNPAIRRLVWDADAIEYFLHRKIEQLSPGYLADVDAADPVQRWLGRATIVDERRDQVERIEDFLLRHTRLLPRDIVSVGNDLCAAIDARRGARRSPAKRETFAWR